MKSTLFDLMIGVVLGSVLTTGLGMAGNLYDRNGNVRAPYGSTQSFDYFRQRQQFLDVQALRRYSEHMQQGRSAVPCPR
jgi:hypothetical protein